MSDTNQYTDDDSDDDYKRLDGAEPVAGAGDGQPIDAGISDDALDGTPAVSDAYQDDESISGDEDDSVTGLDPDLAVPSE